MFGKPLLGSSAVHCLVISHIVQAATGWPDLAQKLYMSLLDGQMTSSPLQEGPHGFLTALLDGEEVTTEVPNLCLAIKKRPAAAPAAATAPAAAAATAAAAAAPAPAAAQDDDKDQEAEEEEEKEGDHEVEAEDEKEQDEEQVAFRPAVVPQLVLPTGWQIVERVRKSGSQMGQKYKEYIGLDGRCYRSLKEVQRAMDME